MHHAIAAAAVRERFTLAELEDDALHDPEIQALRDRISFRHDPQSRYPKYYSGGLIVETTDGRTLEHRELENRGADTRPLSHDDVQRKFMGNVDRRLSDGRAERLWYAVMALDTAEDLAELNEALSL